jgi:hypothetical protein
MFKERFMKKQRFVSAMLAMVLTFGLVFSGCATTHSITFAEQKQPEGDYKQAVISVGSSFFGSASVLQRFYEKYPSIQYEVVAYEKVTKDWMLLSAGGGGMLIGTGIWGGAWGFNMEDVPVLITFTGIGFITGYVLHQLFGNNYVVTYIERHPAALGSKD